MKPFSFYKLRIKWITLYCITSVLAIYISGCGGGSKNIILSVIPNITSFTPDNGMEGTVVTIIGTNLAGVTSVKFNGQETVNITDKTSNALKVTIPIGATTGKIIVITPDSTATSLTDFTITPIAIPIPVITSFTPNSGVIGTEVTIIGNNLTEVDSVNFNGIEAASVTVINATLLKATVPVSATTGKVAVIAHAGTATTIEDFGVSIERNNPDDGSVMVWVPGGTFTMGTSFYIWWSAPYSQLVTLSGYWIYKNEVTVAQYRIFCTATSRTLPPFPTGNSWTGKSGWEDIAMQQHPIVNINWYDCRAYSDWAGASLPTEAQWEYAARGIQGRNYPWGGIGTVEDTYNGWDYTKCAGSENLANQNKSTWPVGSFPTGGSWCGAQDLAGNAMEWCGDWYGNYSLIPVTNPTRQEIGYRLLRGGSWRDDCSYHGRGACRRQGNPDYFNKETGFRCIVPEL